MKGESIIDLATSLRPLAALAYTDRNPGLIKEELVDQFVKALDTKNYVWVKQTQNPSMKQQSSR